MGAPFALAAGASLLLLGLLGFAWRSRRLRELA
jgi:hypothetical protein